MIILYTPCYFKLLEAKESEGMHEGSLLVPLMIPLSLVFFSLLSFR